MKTVYEAANALEAHMIADLLDQADIYARIDGEYLQGGVGELQAFGLVKVRVNDPDFAAARELVSQWETNNQNNNSPVPVDTGESGFGYPHLCLAFVVGLLFGVMI